MKNGKPKLAPVGIDISSVLAQSKSPLALCAAGFALLAEAARRAHEQPSRLAPDSPVYTTQPGHGPPGVSQRKWRAMAPKIRGARRVGRWWVVERAAFDEHVAIEPRRVAAKTNAALEPWSPESALRDVGIVVSKTGTT